MAATRSDPWQTSERSPRLQAHRCFDADLLLVTMARQSMSVYRTQPLRLDRVKTYPLASRTSKVSVADFARVLRPGYTLKRWAACLPHILAGETFRGVVDQYRKSETIWDRSKQYV